MTTAPRKAVNTYVILRFVGEPNRMYDDVGVYRGSSARDALIRFAADHDIEIGEGAASGKHWFSGQNRLSSWGQGQYQATKTTIPAWIATAI